MYQQWNTDTLQVSTSEAISSNKHYWFTVGNEFNIVSDQTAEEIKAVALGSDRDKLTIFNTHKYIFYSSLSLLYHHMGK